MTVSTVSAVASGVVQRNLSAGKNTLAQSVKSLLSASAPAAAVADTSNISAALSLQSQVAGLRAASLNMAQTAGMVESADRGAGAVERILGRLQDLASRAAGSVSESDRRSLDLEFQSLKGEINRTVANIRFNGRLLLDGSVKAEDLGLETDDPNAGLPNLSAEALFGTASLSLASAEGATAALSIVQGAQQELAAARADIAAFSGALELGLATVESAINNQDAARSQLSDNDLTAALDQGVQAKIENAASLSLLAQTNRLPSNLSQLLAE